MLVADSVADATAFDKWRWGSLTSVIDVNDGVMDKSVWIYFLLRLKASLFPATDY